MQIFVLYSKREVKSLNILKEFALICGYLFYNIFIIYTIIYTIILLLLSIVRVL